MDREKFAKPEEMLWFESTISENVEPEVSFVEQEKEEVWFRVHGINLANKLLLISLIKLTFVGKTSIYGKKDRIY